MLLMAAHMRPYKEEPINNETMELYNDKQWNMCSRVSFSSALSKARFSSVHALFYD